MLLISVALYSCKNGAETAREFVIISTNDIHAQIDRFPQLAAFIQQKRAESEEVIVVDAGDRFSGNPYVDNAIEKGEPIIQLMNKVGFEVACMGNHDFDYGQEVLKKRFSEANFPVICANINSEESRLGQMLPYEMIEKGGINFCFLSLIETGANHIPATNPANLENISFRYFKDVAKEYKQLESDCDVMIGLTHLGFANDSLLALVMPEFDVIVGGHSHTVIRDPRVINGVLVTQTGSNLNYVGVTTLKFEGKKLIDKSYSLISLKDFGGADQEVALMVQEINNRPEFKKVLGEATIDLKFKENVASLMTDAMCRAVGADFAFYNKGGVRLNSIPQGPITMEMVYKIEPFANYIVRHKWTLPQMKEFILKDYNRGKDKDKRYINYFISDGKYEIIRDNRGDGVDVKFYDKRGELLKDNAKLYDLAFSNYVASSNPYVAGGENTDIYIADAIAEYLTEKRQIAYNQQRAFVK